MRQAVATNLAVFKLEVSIRVITEGEGLQTIHKTTALGPASNKIIHISKQRQHGPIILISLCVISADTLHNAEFALAHVHKGGTYMVLPLS